MANDSRKQLEALVRRIRVDAAHNVVVATSLFDYADVIEKCVGAGTDATCDEWLLEIQTKCPELFPETDKALN